MADTETLETNNTEQENTVLKEFTPEEVIETILNSPTLFSLLVPEDITAYGIFWGGSRFLELDEETSDYDINIIVSPTDYNKMEATAQIRPTLKIGGTKVHWYYFPTNIRYFNFESQDAYCGLQWWTACALKGLSIEDFWYVGDSSKIQTFILNLETKFIDLLKMLSKEKSKAAIEQLLNTNNTWQTLHKKSYLLIYSGSTLNNKIAEELENIKYIKHITADRLIITEDALPLTYNEELDNMVKRNYQALLDWFKTE